MRRVAVVPLLVVGLAASTATPTHRERAERVVANDNRTAAGARAHDTLRLRLEARLGDWHPDGDSAPGATIAAFAEAGAPPSIPGPLVRVPAGTAVVATVRNTLADTLVVQGLHDRPLAGGAPAAGIVVPPGATATVRFRLGAAGTFYYWGTTAHRTVAMRSGADSQLGGAIVVDEPGAAAADRVFVIGVWSDTAGAALVERKRLLAVINGRSWPHTERLDYSVGDTVRWRLINASADSHPMHLHGFYFRLDSRGNGTTDTTFADAARPRSVTENMIPGATMRLTWVPERPGNWLFHCHLADHFAPRGPLGMALARDAAAADAMNAASHDPGAHARSAMNGLVLGVAIRPRAGAAPVAATAPDGPRRRLRLVVRPLPDDRADVPLFGYLVDTGGGVAASPARVAPPIVLTRGEPVSITVVNGLHVPTSVHWHGIELESYFDGVPGFSGAGTRLAPLIAPGDSFEARFTPPRAGTFIYHTHADEERQQRAGLSGPLVVVEPGTPRDLATTDRAIMITSPMTIADEARAVLIDGSLTPPPLELRAGVTYRLRFVNMTLRRPGMNVQLRRDTALVSWRQLAKDGADLPAARQAPRPARTPLSIGETVDVAFTPDSAGTLRLEVRAAAGLLLAVREVRVAP